MGCSHGGAGFIMGCFRCGLAATKEGGLHFKTLLLWVGCNRGRGLAGHFCCGLVAKRRRRTWSHPPCHSPTFTPPPLHLPLWCSCHSFTYIVLYLPCCIIHGATRASLLHPCWPALVTPHLTLVRMPHPRVSRLHVCAIWCATRKSLHPLCHVCTALTLAAPPASCLAPSALSVHHACARGISCFVPCTLCAVCAPCSSSRHLQHHALHPLCRGVTTLALAASCSSCRASHGCLAVAGGGRAHAARVPGRQRGGC